MNAGRFGAHSLLWVMFVGSAYPLLETGVLGSPTKAMKLLREAGTSVGHIHIRTEGNSLSVLLFQRLFSIREGSDHSVSEKLLHFLAASMVRPEGSGPVLFFVANPQVSAK